jgi:hypothetical protein
MHLYCLTENLSWLAELRGREYVEHHASVLSHRESFLTDWTPCQRIRKAPCICTVSQRIFPDWLNTVTELKNTSLSPYTESFLVARAHFRLYICDVSSYAIFPGWVNTTADYTSVISHIEFSWLGEHYCRLHICDFSQRIFPGWLNTTADYTSVMYHIDSWLAVHHCRLHILVLHIL